MPYVVHATPPPAPTPPVWDDREGFFPRKVHYQADADRLSREARRKGGRNVRVDKTNR